MRVRPLHALLVTHRHVARTVRGNLAVFVALGLLIAVTVGVLVIWLEGARNRVLPKNWGVVEQGLIYRSGQIHGAILERVLEENHILTVIDVSGDTGRSHEAEELAIVDRLGLTKFTVEGLGGDGVGPIDSYARAFVKLVEERRRNRPVLVHCRAGSERTGALISLYRVLVEDWTPEAAYAEYLRYRHRPPRTTVLWDMLNQDMPQFIEHVVGAGALPAAPQRLPRLGPVAPNDPD